MPDEQEDDQRQKEDIASTVEGGIMLEKPVAMSSGIAMIVDGIIIDNHSHTALHGSSHPIVLVSVESIFTSSILYSIILMKRQGQVSQTQYTCLKHVEHIWGPIRYDPNTRFP